MASLTKYSTQLPEEILENQICTTCKLYLSYGPIKSYSTGEIKCGRCSEDNDFGVVSNFNKISKYISFPCVNSRFQSNLDTVKTCQFWNGFCHYSPGKQYRDGSRSYFIKQCNSCRCNNKYEGCPTLLESEEVPSHEKNCPKRLYGCPVCPSNKYQAKPILHLINHFKHNHAKHILKKHILQIQREEEFREIYLSQSSHLNQIILIYVRLNGNILHINASTVGDKPELTKQQVTLYKHYPEKSMHSSFWRPCSAWNTNLETFNFVLPFYIRTITVELNFKYMKNLILSRAHPNSFVKKIVVNKSTVFSNSQLSLKKKLRDIYGYFPEFTSATDISISDCGRYLVENGTNLIDIYCSFCENFYILDQPDDDLYMYTCLNCKPPSSFSLCYRCRKPKIKCKFCFDCLNAVLINTSPFFSINIFCRFNCYVQFHISNINRHEQNCYNNPFLNPDTLLLEQRFGYICDQKPVLRKNNKFDLIDSIFASRNGRVYVIDQRGFEYILDFNRIDDIIFTFTIHHDYDLSMYKLLVNIWENEEYIEKVNCSSFNITYTYYNQFAIVLNEMY